MDFVSAPELTSWPRRGRDKPRDDNNTTALVIIIVIIITHCTPAGPPHEQALEGVSLII